MQITFEVPVILLAKPGRAVNAKTVFGYHDVTLDIPVLDDEDAPVVLRYDTSDRNGSVSHEQFRGFEDQLYHSLPVAPADRVWVQVLKYPVPTVLFDEQLARLRKEYVRIGVSYSGAEIAARVYPPSFAEHIRHKRMECTLGPIEVMDLRGDFEADLVKQVDAFVAIASRLVIVDGQFHLPEPEPLLRIVTASLGDVKYEAVRAHEREVPGLLAGRGLNIDCLGYFRFDEFERMKLEGEAMANGHTFWGSVGNVEVLDGGFLSERADALTLVELAAVFRQYFACSMLDEDEDFNETSTRVARMLATLPIAQIALYQRLCEGMESVRNGGDPAELEEAVLTIMESDHDSMERHLFVYGGNVARYAERIVSRWNDRAVEADPGFTPAPR